MDAGALHDGGGGSSCRPGARQLRAVRAFLGWNIGHGIRPEVSTAPAGPGYFQHDRRHEVLPGADGVNQTAASPQIADGADRARGEAGLRFTRVPAAHDGRVVSADAVPDA